METTILAEKRTDLILLDPRELHVEEGFNDRIDYGDMTWLINNIRENGVNVPLRGYKADGKYYVMYGHRRHQACLALIKEGHEIRVPFVSGKKPSLEDRIVGTFTSNEGKPLNAIEQAGLVSRLEKMNLTVTEIAKKLSLNQTTVRGFLVLATIPTALKNRILKGEMSSSLILGLIKNNKDITPENVEEHINKALEGSDIFNGQGKKVTAATLNKAKGVEPSLSYFKKLRKDEANIDMDLTFEDDFKSDMFFTFCNILDGKYSEAKLKEYFFGK